MRAVKRIGSQPHVTQPNVLVRKLLITLSVKIEAGFRKMLGVCVCIIVIHVL